MDKSKFLNTIHPTIILVGGLGLAQIIATIQVYLSNQDLYHTLEAVNAAGYLAVPNEHLAANLPGLRPAFWGGLFFTFSIGAGISIASMTSAWIWVRIFLCRQTVLIVLIGVWLALMVLVNSDGLALMPTLYFLIVVPAVFGLTTRCVTMTETQTGKSLRWIHFLPIPLLALLWFTQYDDTLFLDIRDNLLLSNAYGRKFSQFYYDYTLYPAEAFKSLNQKSIKTAGIRGIHSGDMNQRLETRLRAYDYLPLPDAKVVDLDILQENNLLVFMQNKQRILQIPIDEFLEDSRSPFLQFSEACDRNGMFRKFTFLSLLIGFPLLCYLVLHALLYYSGYAVMGRRASTVMSSIMCLLIGILVLVYFQSNRYRSIQVPDLPAALSSDRWQMRVAGLRAIDQKKLEIADYVDNLELFKKSTAQDRYWLARALAHSRQPIAFKMLLSFLNDNNLNVRTMGYYALGLRRDRRAIGPILSNLKTTANWYEQMYAYRALRSLGWKQTRSH